MHNHNCARHACLWREQLRLICDKLCDIFHLIPFFTGAGMRTGLNKMLMAPLDDRPTLSMLLFPAFPTDRWDVPPRHHTLVKS